MHQFHILVQALVEDIFLFLPFNVSNVDRNSDSSLNLLRFHCLLNFLGQTLNIPLCNAPPWPRSAFDTSALLLSSLDTCLSPVHLILSPVWLLIYLSQKDINDCKNGHDGPEQIERLETSSSCLRSSP